MTTDIDLDVECYDSDVVVLELDDPGVYLCREDALMLARAIERCDSIVPDLSIIRLGQLLAKCAEPESVLFLRVAP